MQSVFGTLGEMSFRADQSPEAFSVDESTKFAKLSRLGQKPLLQSVGEELRKLSLSFTFGPASQPAASLERLQTAMNAKEPMFLGIGGGRYAGDYVIKSIGSKVLGFLPTGEITDLKVDVSLLEYAPTIPPAESGNFVRVR